MLVLVHKFFCITPCPSPSRSVALRFIVIMLLLFAINTVVAAERQTSWVMHTGDQDYVLEANGSVLDQEGARLALSPKSDATGRTGNAVASVDATPFRFHTVRLSANIATMAANEGAIIWLRADGPKGQLIYASSQTSPVESASSGQQRDVEIMVPHAATKLLVGLLLKGNGRATFDGIKLVSINALEPANVISAQAELDAAIDIVRKNALRAAAVDWKTTEPQVRAKIVDSELSQEAYPAIRMLLASLGDHHSFLMEPVESRKEEHSGVPSAAPIVDEQPASIGYVAMPGYLGTGPQAAVNFATDLTVAINRLGSTIRCGWIVDLRGDRGGNMWPMLAALKPLLGDGPLGYFKDRNGLSEAWRAGQWVSSDLPAAVDLTGTPVAVLIGPRTASSGEALAIAFQGRPRTRFFGAPTAGVPTGNASHKLPDGAQIFLTQTTELDRLKREYNGPIGPDEVVDQAASMSEDRVLAASRAWLLSEAGCGR